MELQLEVIERPTATELKIGEKASNIIAQCNRAIINSVDAMGKAATLCRYISEARNAADKERLAITKPFRDGVAAINNRYKLIDEPLEAAEKTLRKKMLDFNLAENKRLAYEAEAERKRLQAIADAEHAAKMEEAKKEVEAKHQAHLKELEEQAKKLKAEGKTEEQIAIACEPPLAPSELPPPPVVKVEPKKLETVRGVHGGKAHTKGIWKFKVIDFSKLPDRYKSLNEMLIKSAIQMGSREIEGLEIYEEETLVVGR